MAKTQDAKSDSFKQFNDEINEFYKNLKDNHFSDEEIRKILSPILTTADYKKTKIFATTLATSVVLLLLVYFLAQFETISWHCSALARIFLIKLLPLWDWTVLKNQKCLIERSSIGSNSAVFEIGPQFNCELCKNIDALDAYKLTDGTYFDQDLLEKRYLDVHNPVILMDSLKDWIKQDFDLEKDLLNDHLLIKSVPCNLASNVYNGAETTIENLIHTSQFFDRFFVHFQNCQLDAVKHFRKFASRPKFLPVELAPIQYSWLVWSKDYNSSTYKKLSLVDKIAVWGQIEGSNYIKLVPRANCYEECREIDVKLVENEVLVLTSLWDVEYRPLEHGENLAVVLETH